MTKIVYRLLLGVIGVLSSLTGFAQEKVEMADGMRSNGKIYIVVAVCLTILIGLFLYMTMLDRKMSRLEKNKNAE
jgi:fluoride ion exporter CrcB/FEX